MELVYYKPARYEKPTVCPHNDHCRCVVKNCYKCGWNPIVFKMRIEKLKKELCEED